MFYLTDNLKGGKNKHRWFLLFIIRINYYKEDFFHRHFECWMYIELPIILNDKLSDTLSEIFFLIEETHSNKWNYVFHRDLQVGSGSTTGKKRFFRSLLSKLTKGEMTVCSDWERR